MGWDVEIFLAERPDVGTILGGLGWAASADDAYLIEGRGWFAQIKEPTPMSSEDAPPEAVALQAGIGWHVAAGLEGGDAGRSHLRRAIRAIAKAGHGVIADETYVRSVGGARRVRSTPISKETEFLKMIWWMGHDRIVSVDGATSLLETIADVVPEALPQRWGDFEPPNLNIDDEGIPGLARYIARRHSQGRGGYVITKVRAPFSAFEIHSAICLGEDQPWQMGIKSLVIEVGGSILDQPGWPRQLSRAFREISLAVNPFYGEARIERDVTWKKEWGGRLRAHVLPMSEMAWSGFPRVAPMAMVVGPPYTGSWNDPHAPALEDLIVYSADLWPDAPASGVPVAGDDLLQEFDPRYQEVPPPYPGCAPGVTGDYPSRVPDVWPFGR